mgnify:CR=1 FL=1
MYLKKKKKMKMIIITIIVSVQNARVSSNAHSQPREKSVYPPLDARFWPRIAPLHKTPKTTHDAYDSKTHMKKRETKTMMKMIRARQEKENKKKTMKNNCRRRHPLQKRVPLLRVEQRFQVFRRRFRHVDD